MLPDLVYKFQMICSRMTSVQALSGNQSTDRDKTRWSLCIVAAVCKFCRTNLNNSSLSPLVYIRKLSYAFLKRYLLQYPKHFRLVSETLSLFWANQILYLHLDAALLAENQKMLILKSLVLPDQESNPWSTALEAIKLTITLTRLWYRNKVHVVNYNTL